MCQGIRAQQDGRRGQGSGGWQLRLPAPLPTASPAPPAPALALQLGNGGVQGVGVVLEGAGWMRGRRASGHGALAGRANKPTSLQIETAHLQQQVVKHHEPSSSPPADC